MNWRDPAERFALIQRVGVTEYKRLHAEHMAKSVVETVTAMRSAAPSRNASAWSTGSARPAARALTKTNVGVQRSSD